MKKTIVLTFIFCVLVCFTACDTTNSSTITNNNSSRNTETSSKEDANTSSLLETSLASYINNVINQYNAQAAEQLTYVEDFIPSNKDSGHYRTEFRLSAYNNALGKCYLLGNKKIDIVVSQTYFGDINCRIYTTDTSFEQVISLITGMSPIMDETLSPEELATTIAELSERKYANGYYYGNLGILLSGSESSGYELMIKND